MPFDLGRNGRTLASATFYGLALLAFGLLVALSGFMSYFAPIYQTCKSVWDNLLLWLSSLGALVPIVVISTFVLLAGLSLFRQWRATRRLLQTLARQRVPAPPRLKRLAREVGLENRLDCVDGWAVGPFCYGFAEPRVCIPIALLDVLEDSELQAVLRHEGYHAQSRDPLKIWLIRALARGLCFLPLAGELRDSYLSAKEIAADEIMARSDELPLASALVKIISAGETRLAPATTATALGQTPVAGLISISHEPANGTEKRIRRLIDGEPAPLNLPSLKSVLLSVLVVVGIFAVSYTNLSATSMVPVSQECVSQRLLRRPDTNVQPAFGERQNLLGSEWSVSELKADERPALLDAPTDSAVDRVTCDLLKPSCP